jgi:hypothetical protein
MRTFACPDCSHLVVFENLVCLHSQTPLAFDWHARDFVSLGDAAACANRELAACNGAAEPGGLCFSCALTRTRPADGDEEGLLRFAKAEAAKRRLLFGLLELGLPVEGYRERSGALAFDLLNSRRGEVTTGHADGVITIDLAEADDAHRERLREQMDEPYRTVLGHMRHEVAHYYEPILCPDGSPARERFRELFGDERADYREAIDRHYSQGPPADWESRFVSAYATMHPWEDWAETAAHYMHIRDTLETSVAYGVSVAGPPRLDPQEPPLYSFPAAASEDTRGLLDAWLPLTYALNALNRSMGVSDIYPFVIAPVVVEKLDFIDGLVRETSAVTAAG